MKIAVLKEMSDGERRVSATPETVKKFIGLGATVAVEAGAGESASVSDADYQAAGATTGSRADALASTANFLAGHGWQRGAGYQPGQPSFAAIQGWNAATVYQQAIAYIGKEIDGQ